MASHSFFLTARPSQHGSVSLDGYDLETLNIEWLRSSIGIVSQEPALFATSIGENISYGLLGVNGDNQPRHEDIVAAAKMANAHKFTQAFPNQYDTMVSVSIVKMCN